MNKFIIFFIFLVLVGAGGAIWYFFFYEKPKPEVTITETGKFDSIVANMSDDQQLVLSKSVSLFVEFTLPLDDPGMNLVNSIDVVWMAPYDGGDPKPLGRKTLSKTDAETWDLSYTVVLTYTEEDSLDISKFDITGTNTLNIEYGSGKLIDMSDNTYTIPATTLQLAQETVDDNKQAADDAAAREEQEEQEQNEEAEAEMYPTETNTFYHYEDTNTIFANYNNVQFKIYSGEENSIRLNQKGVQDVFTINILEIDWINKSPFIKERINSFDAFITKIRNISEDETLFGSDLDSSICVSDADVEYVTGTKVIGDWLKIKNNTIENNGASNTITSYETVVLKLGKKRAPPDAST